MKISPRWLVVALLLLTMSVPVTLMATDGNPDGPTPKGGIVISVPSK